MTRFGFYYNLARYAYKDKAQNTWQDQVDHGMSTVTIPGEDCGYFGPSPGPGNADYSGLVRQVEGMLDVGLLSTDCPALIFGLRIRQIAEAKKYATSRWPEIIVSNVDEANTHHTEDALIHNSFECKEFGLRCGTTLTGNGFIETYNSPDYGAKPLGDYLDVWIVSVTAWNERLVNEAREKGKELWAYWCFPHADDKRIRYIAGMWAWKHQPKSLLFWAYTHSPNTRINLDGTTQWTPGDMFSYVLPSIDGPQETSHYRAIAEGIKDYHALCKLEESGGGSIWLSKLKDTIPNAVRTYPNPYPDVDLDGIRADAENPFKKPEPEPTPEQRKITTLHSMMGPK